MIGHHGPPFDHFLSFELLVSVGGACWKPAKTQEGSRRPWPCWKDQRGCSEGRGLGLRKFVHPPRLPWQRLSSWGGHDRTWTGDGGQKGLLPLKSPEVQARQTDQCIFKSGSKWEQCGAVCNNAQYYTAIIYTICSQL